MTRVDFNYRFTAQFDERWLGAIERLHAVYGMQAVRLNAQQDGLQVSIDATRLAPADLDRRLWTAGLPVARV